MAEKDTGEKYLEEYPDVFADIVNVLLLEGEYIRPEELYDGPTESIYKAENGIDIKEQRRDISKYYIKDNKIKALIGIENQSTIDYDMPIRVSGYDYSSYRSQIVKGSDRYPVITLVLNFSNKEWNAPLSLSEVFDCSKELDGCVSDYSIKVVNVAYIPEEIRAKFKSDFKLIVDFFNQKRFTGSYVPSGKNLKHEMAVLNMLKIFTTDKRYYEIEESVKMKKRKGEVITMCTFADEMENRGRILEAVFIYSKEMKLNENQVMQKIMQRFSLSSEEAGKYLK